jgi:hypothetical protein
MNPNKFNPIPSSINEKVKAREIFYTLPMSIFAISLWPAEAAISSGVQSESSCMTSILNYRYCRLYWCNGTTAGQGYL